MKHFYIDPKTVLGGIVYSDLKQEIVHLSLQKGNTVPTYQLNAQINLFVIEGCIELYLETDERVKVVNERELVVLEADLPHRMKALKDSQILVVKVK